MSGDDLQSCSHGEAKQRNKRIPEANAVYIAVSSKVNELTNGLIAAQKTIQNR